MQYPSRQSLPHETPLGLASEDATFFITICAAARGSDDLLRADCAAALLEAVRHRHNNGIWWCRLFVVMPDHVHGLIRFPLLEHPLVREIPEFKKFTARMLGIRWQRDFSITACGGMSPSERKRTTSCVIRSAPGWSMIGANGRIFLSRRRRFELVCDPLSQRTLPSNVLCW